MFTNKISARDLIGGGSSQGQSTYAYGRNSQNDFSQLQNAQFTQFELSHGNSQEFFSEPSQFSATQRTNSQAENKVSSYEKYMSMPSLFKGKPKPATASSMSAGNKDGQQKKPMMNYQQQLANQKAKAKERDERDMLSSIVSIVKECSDEVKHSLCSMKSAEEDNGAVLVNSIKGLTQSLEESSDRILKAVKDKEDQTHQISSLHRQLRQKDEKIQELLQQKTVQDSNSVENTTSVIETMKTFFLEHQTQTEKKIKKVLESTQEQLQLAKEMGTKQQTGVDENNKHYQDVKYTSQRQFQDIEKRLADEFVLLRDDFERQKRDTEGFVRNQVQSLQQKYSRELQQHIHKGMSESMKQLYDNVGDPGRCMADIKDMCELQQRDIEKCIKSNTLQQTKHILKQNQDLYSKQKRDIHSSLQGKLDTLKTDQEQIVEETKSCLEEIKTLSATSTDRPWKNDNVSKKIQDQLDDMRNKHQTEIRRLEGEMESQKKARQQEAERKKKEQENEMKQLTATGSKLQNIYDFAEEEMNATGDCKTRANNQGASTAMFKKNTNFLSPRPPQGNWNSRTLFARRNPSPVATVLPQRQQNMQVASTVQSSATIQQTTAAAAPSIQVASIGRQQTNVQQPFEAQNQRQLRSRSNINQGNVYQANVAAITQVTSKKRKRNVRVEQNEASEISETSGESQISLVSSGETKAVGTSNQKRRGRKRGSKKPATCTKDQNLNVANSNQEATITSPVNSFNRKQHVGHIADRNVASRSAAEGYGLVARKPMQCVPFNNKDNDVFSFSDVSSPVGPVMRRKSNWQAAEGSRMVQTYDSDSQGSSPSMDVTEIFIRRKVSCERRWPQKVDQTETADMTSDFLCAPNPQAANQGRPTVRRAIEKRTLCDLDTMIPHLMGQKMKRY